jgi:hypothetical protein
MRDNLILLNYYDFLMNISSLESFRTYCKYRIKIKVFISFVIFISILTIIFFEFFFFFLKNNKEYILRLWVINREYFLSKPLWKEKLETLSFYILAKEYIKLFKENEMGFFPNEIGKMYKKIRKPKEALDEDDILPPIQGGIFFIIWRYFVVICIKFKDFILNKLHIKPDSDFLNIVFFFFRILKIIFKTPIFFVSKLFEIIIYIIAFGKNLKFFLFNNFLLNYINIYVIKYNFFFSSLKFPKIKRKKSEEVILHLNKKFKLINFLKLKIKNLKFSTSFIFFIFKKYYTLKGSLYSVLYFIFFRVPLKLFNFQKSIIYFIFGVTSIFKKIFLKFINYPFFFKLSKKKRRPLDFKSKIYFRHFFYLHKYNKGVQMFLYKNQNKNTISVSNKLSVFNKLFIDEKIFLDEIKNKRLLLDEDFVLEFLLKRNIHLTSEEYDILVFLYVYKLNNDNFYLHKHQHIIREKQKNLEHNKSELETELLFLHNILEKKIQSSKFNKYDKLKIMQNIKDKIGPQSSEKNEKFILVNIFISKEWFFIFLVIYFLIFTEKKK